MYITRARTLRFPQFNMHPISSAQKENIISLASNGLPTRQIASKLGVGKSTVSRVLQDLLPNRQTPSSGRPARLSPTNKRSIITQITTGRSSNAVQATKHINTIISHPVSPQTVRNVLKEHSFKAVTKKKKPLLTAVHRKKRLAFAYGHSGREPAYAHAHKTLGRNGSPSHTSMAQ
jgi:IS30 family transposase